jgi:hypothetical protein
LNTHTLDPLEPWSPGGVPWAPGDQGGYPGSQGGYPGLQETRGGTLGSRGGTLGSWVPDGGGPGLQETRGGTLGPRRPGGVPWAPGAQGGRYTCLLVFPSGEGTFSSGRCFFVGLVIFHRVSTFSFVCLFFVDRRETAHSAGERPGPIQLISHS